jgi:hypothetical protein
MKRGFSRKYGKPKVEFFGESQQTVYRWKDPDVKIKLKLRETSGEIKLAIYFSPLAAKVNQEQLEQVPADAFGPPPSKTCDTVETAPLIEF